MADPTKVYIVTSGCYSAYQIDNVFLSKDDAKWFLKHYKEADSWDVRIEEYDIGVRKEYILYGIGMDLSGDTFRVEMMDYDDSSGEYFDERYKTYNFCIEAKNRKHAIKIANEHRIQHISERNQNIRVHNPLASIKGKIVSVK